MQHLLHFSKGSPGYSNAIYRSLEERFLVMKNLQLLLLACLRLISPDHIQALIHRYPHNPGPQMLHAGPILPKYGYEYIMACILCILTVLKHVEAGAVDFFIVGIK
ncbi:hypothetical protein D1872_289220 [compost metagenome]